MGQDKALLPHRGVPLARLAADALRGAGSLTTVAVGGNQSRLQEIGLDWMPDLWPGEGPLGGILTALDSLGTDDVAVVLSCDLLEPSSNAIRHVVDHRARTDADVAVPLLGGREQWLHGCWHARVGGILRDLFLAGERSVAGGVQGLRVEVTRLVDLDALVDADAPDDLR